MQRLRYLFVALILLAPSLAFGQNGVLQGGPWTAGHAPMYSGSGSGQAIVNDSGSAAGGAANVGLSELGITSRSGNGVSSPPYASNGNGQYSSHFCMYDGPITNASGYHYLCLDPNAQGGPLFAVGNAGTASALPFKFYVNGNAYSFPYTVGGIVGPNTTVAANIPVWGNTAGSLLANSGVSSLGTSIYPTYVVPTTTTANTTNLSNSIVVASSTGISLGDSINASFTANNTYVTNIAGTTITMSQNATSTNTGASVTFGRQRMSTTSTLLVNTVGAQDAFFGSAAQGRSSWVNAYFGQTDSFSGCCALIAISPTGQNSAIFAARSSDDSTSGPSGTTTIPESCLVLSDNTVSNKRVWCQYVESRARSTAFQYQLFGVENDLENQWTSVTSNPFSINPVGSTIGYRIASGVGTSSGTTPVTTALDIVNNGNTFNTGIMFQDGALTEVSSVSTALALAPRMAIKWFGTAGGGTNQADMFWEPTNGFRLFMGSASAGLAAPGAGSVGQRIQLYGTAGTVGAGDYAIGLDSGTIWFTSGAKYAWYNAGTKKMTLETASGFTVYADSTFNGSITSSDHIASTTGFYTGASMGLTATRTVRATGGGADCTLIFTGGIYTGGTC